jgi:hypothetical protein
VKEERNKWSANIISNRDLVIRTSKCKEFME